MALFLYCLDVVSIDLSSVYQEGQDGQERTALAGDRRRTAGVGLSLDSA